MLGVLCGGASADAAPPAPPDPAVRVIISCSSLIRSFHKLDHSKLAGALFLFGSKRAWLFPSTEAERRDAARQPGKYHAMAPELRELILAKEAACEVHFLKAPELAYEGYPGDPDPDAYRRVSRWLEGRGLGPLQLDPGWWTSPSRDCAGWAHCRSGRRVADNFTAGFHEYGELKELLQQSYAGRVVPLMGHEPELAAGGGGQSAQRHTQ